MKTKTALALIAAALAALTPPASAEVRVSGIIDRETRWKAEDGPYILEGDLLVTRFGNLVIAPGTRVIVSAAAKKGDLAPPLDKADSTLVSIRVKGVLNCIGRRNNPIVFEPEKSGHLEFPWRGIILDKADDRYTEIAFTEISGATTGVTVRNTGSVVRNSAIENCNIGILAAETGSPRLYNNMITGCFTAGIKIERSNPQILNNIIAFNNNIGLWCDNSSKITVKYNCVFGNADGNFLDCDPELGKMSRGGKGKDSTDANSNITTDPIFAGSSAEAKAIELDVNLPTDSSKVKDKKLLGIPNIQFGPPRKKEPTTLGSEVRQLSKYSPCINAGDPSGAFKNMDGTKNTIGPSGGQDFFAK
jgi:parallel beta-helix repeat protein